MSTALVALGRFNRLARQGAHTTATALEDLTHQPTQSLITDVRLSRHATLADRFERGEYVGVHAPFTGQIDGTAVIAMPYSDVATITDAMGGQVDHWESGIDSVGHIAASGFVDVIANATGSAVRLDPPEVVDSSRQTLIPDAGGDAEFLVTISSEFEFVDEVLDLDVVLLPDSPSTFSGRTESQDSSAVDRLHSIGELTRNGAAKATEQVSKMAGQEATVTVRRIRMAPIETLVDVSDPCFVVGTISELEEPPEGYLALFFDESAAAQVAATLLPNDLDEPPSWRGPGKSAISELGTVVTRGFLEGWAQTMGASVAHSPPVFVADDSHAIISSLVAELAEGKSAGVVVDVEVSLDGRSIPCSLHELPTPTGFETALQHIGSLGTG